MKNLCYLLILISGICNAQIVNIPDANFKNRLVNTSCVDINNDGTYDSDADTNNDGEIQFSEALLVTNLNVSNSLIIDLTGIENFTNLQSLNCSLNNITDLEVRSLTNLWTLFCYYNQLTSIDVSGLYNLRSFYCNNNQITEINLTGVTNLWILHAEFNQLTTLDLNGVNFDVFVDCSDNNLTSLFIKNGKNVVLDNTGLYCQCSGNMYFFNNPNLSFVCCDEGEISSIQAYSGTANYSNFVANSFCSFIPGGNYNTISGNVKFDADNNGCDINDSVQPNIRMNIAEPNTSGATFTNNAGNYSFYTQAGTFTLTPDIENPSWYNFSPNSADVVFADNNNNIATQDFCIAANGFHPDIEVVISTISPARPGFNAVYQITYKNKGNQTQNGVVTFTFDDEKIDFVSATQSPNLQNIGSLQWDFGVLKPYESRTIVVTLHVNSPTDTIPVTIGDILGYTVSLETVEVDETPADNQFTFNQTVVGSYDPNDISCLEGNSLPPSEIGNYLHYAINFENTGNYPAENIVVKTEVDATKFDINSLQLLATSNPVDARITGNKVEFIFQNIQLPIGGHGHILLKVKSKSTLVTGDSVAKRADIFFDYNAPIDTGFANTTFQTLSNTIFETDTTINVYPNPTTSKITINSDFDLKSIQVYDVQGRILETLIGANKILDISNKANGVYFLKITTNKGSKIEKVIKK